MKRFQNSNFCSRLHVKSFGSTVIRASGEQAKQAEAKKWFLEQVYPYLQLFMHPTEKGYATPWMAYLKEGLALRGINVGVPRKPIQPLQPAEKKKLTTLLDQYGYLAK